MSRLRKPWTDVEIETLVDGYNEGKTYEVLATELGRNIGRIYAKCRQLRLPKDRRIVREKQARYAYLHSQRYAMPETFDERLEESKKIVKELADIEGELEWVDHERQIIQNEYLHLHRLKHALEGRLDMLVKAEEDKLERAS